MNRIPTPQRSVEFYPLVCIRSAQNCVEVGTIKSTQTIMKNILNPRLTLAALLGALILASAITGRAETPPPAAEAPRELTVVIVESLSGRSLATDSYERIARVFTSVFEKRKWPVTIKTERFAADTVVHPTELRIFFQGITEDVPGELRFRAWVTLSDHDTKTDFGVVTYRSNPRPSQPVEDRLDQSVRGAAGVVADKIEPILFPKAGTTKP